MSRWDERQNDTVKGALNGWPETVLNELHCNVMCKCKVTPKEPRPRDLLKILHCFAG